MVSDSAEPQTGHALRPSCWSVSKTSAMKAGGHRISSYTSIRPAEADVDGEAGAATTAPAHGAHVTPQAPLPRMISDTPGRCDFLANGDGVPGRPHYAPRSE